MGGMGWSRQRFEDGGWLVGFVYVWYWYGECYKCTGCCCGFALSLHTLLLVLATVFVTVTEVIETGRYAAVLLRGFRIPLTSGKFH
jgi:hypothetical protein